MPDALTDPRIWSLAILAAAILIVVGRIRHDPPVRIALIAIGFAAFVVGMGWATAIGGEAQWAAYLASFGMAAVAQGYVQVPRSRTGPEDST